VHRAPSKWVEKKEEARNSEREKQPHSRPQLPEGKKKGPFLGKPGNNHALRRKPRFLGGWKRRGGQRKRGPLGIGRDGGKRKGGNRRLKKKTRLMILKYPDKGERGEKDQF